MRRQQRSSVTWIETFFSPALILIALAVSGPVQAKKVNLSLELGVFAGVHVISPESALGRLRGAGPQSELQPGPQFGLRLGYVVHPNVVLEGELALTPTSTVVNPSIQVLAISYRGHLVVNILTGRIRPFVLIGGGARTSSSGNPRVVLNDTDGVLDTGIGLKADVQKNWGLRLDGRVAFGPATQGIYFTEDFEITVSAYGLFGRTPPPATPAPPPSPKDTDGDGLPDRTDACPADKGQSENKGCPDKDTDADGLVDRLDSCATESGPAENKGCPDVDTDGDGLLDRLDNCPNEAGIPENQGCPDKDSDGDGLIDRVDRCPNEPETVNQFTDEDGCPDDLPAALKEFLGPIYGIVFQANSARIDKLSIPVLDKLVDVLAEISPVHVEISAHTELRGKPEKNQALSVQRAEAVKTYLVEHGVGDDRITAVGHGAQQPLVSAKTTEANTKNRRIELRIVAAQAQ